MAKWRGILLLILAIVMIAISWQKWADVLIDFGREVYVPWQISEGSVLYRDIAYFNGPVSPHINALIFNIFGASLTTIFFFNILLILISAWLIYRLARETAGESAAFWCAAVFLGLFAFGHYLNTGNYNFVAPYSHDLVHGFVLSLAGFYFYKRYQASEKLLYLGASGLLFGLAFLTKFEVALAVAAVMAIFLWREKIRRVLFFKALFLAPMIVSFVYFSNVMPVKDALSAMVLPYVAPFAYSLSSIPFYRSLAGLDQPLANLGLILLWSVIFASIYFLARWWSNYSRTIKNGGRIIMAIITGAIVYLILLALGWGTTSEMFRALPAVVIAIGLLAYKSRDKFVLAFSIFSLVLLLKIILKVGIFHYGFVLALPAVLLMAAAARFLPKEIVGGLLAAVILVHIGFSAHKYGNKNFLISTDQGSLKIEYSERTIGADLLLKRLSQLVKPGETIAVMPEGVMINFLLQRANPTPYINLMPVELKIFGEDKIAASLAQTPPDYIALVDKDTGEYGARYFGRDYGVKIMEWVRANYEAIEVIGREPFRGQFGVAIYRKKV